MAAISGTGLGEGGSRGTLAAGTNESLDEASVMRFVVDMTSAITG